MFIFVYKNGRGNLFKFIGILNGCYNVVGVVLYVVIFWGGIVGFGIVIIYC